MADIRPPFGGNGSDSYRGAPHGACVEGHRTDLDDQPTCQRTPGRTEDYLSDRCCGAREDEKDEVFRNVRRLFVIEGKMTQEECDEIERNIAAEKKQKEDQEKQGKEECQ